MYTQVYTRNMHTHFGKINVSGASCRCDRAVAEQGEIPGSPALEADRSTSYYNKINQGDHLGEVVGSQGGAVIKLKALVLSLSFASSERLTSNFAGTQVSSAQQRSSQTSKYTIQNKLRTNFENALTF